MTDKRPQRLNVNAMNLPTAKQSLQVDYILLQRNHLRFNFMPLVRIRTQNITSKNIISKNSEHHQINYANTDLRHQDSICVV